MTDLREALDRLLVDEPPAPDHLERALTAGRRHHRRRAAAVTAAVAVAATAGVVLAVPDRDRDTVAVAASPTPSATETPAPFATAEYVLPECPEGQGPSITVDRGTVVARGTDVDGSFLSGYVAQHLQHAIYARPTPLVLVDGERVLERGQSAWVPGEQQDHSTFSEYVAADGPSTWVAYRATFLGCVPS